MCRPYGIRVYLSARFSAPMEIGGLSDRRPARSARARLVAAKADEIYRLIPDFGGFLVKANSEGPAGPAGLPPHPCRRRQHARRRARAAWRRRDLARVRLFGASEEDRAKQAYDEFKPLDGKFRGNVILQVKNGPIDFQPREPFHPLFGAMPERPS